MSLRYQGGGEERDCRSRHPWYGKLGGDPLGADTNNPHPHRIGCVCKWRSAGLDMVRLPQCTTIYLKPLGQEGQGLKGGGSSMDSLLHISTEQSLAGDTKRNLSDSQGRRKEWSGKCLCAQENVTAAPPPSHCRGTLGWGGVGSHKTKPPYVHFPTHPPLQDALVHFLHVAVGWSGVLCNPLCCQCGSSFRGQDGSEGWRANSLIGCCLSRWGQVSPRV